MASLVLPCYKTFDNIKILHKLSNSHAPKNVVVLLSWSTLEISSFCVAHVEMDRLNVAINISSDGSTNHRKIDTGNGSMYFLNVGLVLPALCSSGSNFIFSWLASTMLTFSPRLLLVY